MRSRARRRACAQVTTPSPACQCSTTARRSPIAASPASSSRIGGSATICARCSRAYLRRSRPSTRGSLLPPPPIQGIGNAGGFTLQVELRDGSTDFASLSTSPTPCRQCAVAKRVAARVDVVPRRGAAIARRGRQGQGQTLSRSIRSLPRWRPIWARPMWCSSSRRPRLPGFMPRPGRRHVPAAAARYREPVGAQPARQHGAARHGGRGHAGGFCAPLISP